MNEGLRISSNLFRLKLMLQIVKSILFYFCHLSFSPKSNYRAVVSVSVSPPVSSPGSSEVVLLALAFSAGKKIINSVPKNLKNLASK